MYVTMVFIEREAMDHGLKVPKILNYDPPRNNKLDYFHCHATCRSTFFIPHLQHNHYYQCFGAQITSHDYYEITKSGVNFTRRLAFDECKTGERLIEMKRYIPRICTSYDPQLKLCPIILLSIAKFGELWSNNVQQLKTQTNIHIVHRT